MIHANPLVIALLLLFTIPRLEGNPEEYTRKQLHHLEATAHTAADYRILEDYFSRSAKRFADLSEKEQVAYQQAIDHPIPGGKFPTSADIAHRWSEYYKAQLEEALKKKTMYEQRLQTMKEGAEENR